MFAIRFVMLALTMVLAATSLGGCSDGQACKFSTECGLSESCIEGTCQTTPVVGRDAALDSSTDVRLRDSASEDAADVACSGVDCPGIPEHLWSQTFGGPSGLHTVRALAVDSAGDVILIGKVSSPTVLAGEIVDTRGLGDVLVAKYSADGTFLWAKSFGSSNEDSGRGIAVDSENNIYVTGHYRGPNVFMDEVSLPHTLGDDRNMFVASFQPNGQHRWSRGYQGFEINAGNDIVVQGDNVFVVGVFQGEFRSALGSLFSSGERDVLVLRFDREGDLIWQQQYGSVGDDHALSCELEASSGNVVLSGSFGGATGFGVLGDRTPKGSRDLFVMTVQPDGTEAELFTLGAIDGSIVGDAIAVGSDGIYVAGLFNGTIDFGDGPVTADANDAFIIGLAPDLSPRWTLNFGGPGLDRVRKLELGSDGQLLVTGAITGNVRVAGEDLEGGLEDSNIVLASYNSANGTPHWALGLGSPGNDEGWGAVAFEDTVYVSGWVRDQANLGGELLSGTEDGSAVLAAYRIR